MYTNAFFNLKKRKFLVCETFKNSYLRYLTSDPNKSYTVRIVSISSFHTFKKSHLRYLTFARRTIGSIMTTASKTIR